MKAQFNSITPSSNNSTQEIDSEAFKLKLESINKEFKQAASGGHPVPEKRQVAQLLADLKQFIPNVIAKANVSDKNAQRVADISEQSLIFLKTIAKNEAIFGVSREDASQSAQSLVTATQQFFQTEKDLEERARTFEELRGRYYLDYLKEVYSEKELQALKAGHDVNSPINAKDFDFISKQVLLPNHQDISYEASKNAPDFPIQIHYNHLNDGQIEEMRQAFRQVWEHVNATWKSRISPESNPMSQTMSPVTSVNVTDNRAAFGLLMHLSNRAPGPTIEGQFYSGDNAAFLYKHEKDPDYFKYVALHEIMHAVANRVFGSLNSTPTLSEGMASYYADVDGKYSWQEALKEKELSLSEILDSKQGYTWGALFIKYLVEKPEFETWREKVLSSVQQGNQDEMLRLLSEFAQEAQPGFKEFLGNLREKLGIDSHLPLYNSVLEKLRSRHYNLDEVKEAVEKGMSVNPYGGQPYGLLHYAITHHDRPLVDFLLSKGADIEARVGNRESPAEFAKHYGYSFKPVEAMSADQAKESRDYVSEYSDFVRVINTIRNHEAGMGQVQGMIDAKAPLNPPEGVDIRSRLVNYAITNPHTEIALVKLLVKHGAVLDDSMFELATRYQRDKSYLLTLKELIQNPSQSLDQNKNSESQIEQSSMEVDDAPQLSQAPMTVEQDAPARKRKRSADTAEFNQSAVPAIETPINQNLAAEREEAFETEETSQVKAKAQSLENWKQAKQALIEGDYKKFEKLLPSLSAHIAYADEKGNNLFHYAALYGDSKTVHHLSAACIAQFEQEQSTHTHGSFGLLGQPPLGRFYDALSRANQDGNSPLHLVIQKNRGEPVARAFIEQGANLKAPVNHLKQTPVSLAKQDPRLGPFFDRVLRTKQIQYNLIKGDKQAALQILQAKDRIYRKGFSFNIWNRSDGSGYKRVNGANLLHFAVQTHAHSEVMQAIMDKAVDVNYQDQDGETPLHYAVRTGNIYAMVPLLRGGASLEIKNNEDKTPLDIAGEEMKDALLRAQELANASTTTYRNAYSG